MTEEWTKVTKAKKSKNGSEPRRESIGKKKPVKVISAKSNLNMQLEATEFNASEFDRTMDDLRLSSFVRNLTYKLSTLRSIDSLVGLGIGSPTSSASSRLQLALMCILGEDLFRGRGENDSTSNLCIFDPVMSSQDQGICLSLGITVLVDNVKGKHDNKGINTLYFMPHCPYRLYCNVLWSNWEHLTSVFILGNSFNSYSLRRISSNSSSKSDLTDTVMRLLPFLSEVELWSSGFTKDTKNNARLSAIENAFCDLSLMCLPVESDERQVTLTSLLSNRASEESIDLSSQNDEELF